MALVFVGILVGSLGWHEWKNRCNEDACKDLITLEGGCHCEKVRYRFTTPRKTKVWVCNCSICVMKQNHHIVVNDNNFSLLNGQEALTTYTFNTRVAKHIFCKHCGVCSFYKPRSNPDGIGITVNAVDTPKKLELEHAFFDGENWEDYYATSAGSSIKGFSAAS
jgi:hypothetical protein